ncbi:MAG: hypothetical protein ACREVN_11040 [Gammaproteobacteria bacterium]
MNLFNRRWAAVCAAIAALQLFGAGPVMAQADSPDAKALAEYRLTDEGVENFTKASRNLIAAFKADPGLGQAMEGSDNATIAETAAAYDAQPAVRKAIESADMTSKEYITFMYSMFQAGLAGWLVEEYGQTELPEGTPRENVDYYLAHKEELAALSAELQELSGEAEAE